MSEFKKIGTIEILSSRIYALDPMMADEALATQVIVEPGIFPILSDGYTTLWMMTGHINGFHFRRGDGMFIMGRGGDPLQGLEVTFPSRSYGPDEWQEFINHPVCNEGDGQRIRINIVEEA
jgi:hypothetical protein